MYDKSKAGQGLELDALRDAIENAKRNGVDAAEAERRLRAEMERQQREENERRRRELQQQRDDDERRRREANEQRQREDDARKRREKEDRLRKEAGERKRKEEQDRLRREADERKRRDAARFAAEQNQSRNLSNATNAAREAEQLAAKQMAASRTARKGGAGNDRISATRLSGALTDPTDLVNKVVEHLLRRGFSPELAEAAAKKAAELLQADFSPGAAALGGSASAEALEAGCSKHCADEAALASAKAAEVAGDRDPEVALALADGHPDAVPSDVYNAVLAAGRAAGKVCMTKSGGARGGGHGGSVVDALLAKGFSPAESAAAGQKALELLKAGFSMGAAYAGGIGYAEGLKDGLSKHCANTAALAAARYAQTVGDRDPYVRAALQRDEVPSEVLEESLAAAKDAGRRCMNSVGGADNGSVMQHLISRGYPQELARAAAKKAAELRNAGYSPGSAYAGGIAFGEALANGCSRHCADRAALAAAAVADKAGKRHRKIRQQLQEGTMPDDVFEAATKAGAAAAKNCMEDRDAEVSRDDDDDLEGLSADELRRRGYDVRLLGERDKELRKWTLPSSAADSSDETSLLAQLDAAFQPSKLGAVYDQEKDSMLNVDVLDEHLPVQVADAARRSVIQEHVIQERLGGEGGGDEGGCTVM